MNAKQFFYKVSAMREAQKRYFKYRTSDELSKARILEKEIDEEIKRVNQLTAKRDPDYIQGDLFS